MHAAIAVLVCLFFAAVHSVVAMHMSANETAAMGFLHPGADEALETVAFLESVRGTLTTEDFLAVPFDTNTAEDAAVLAALTHNKEAFQAFRENAARTAYHMELNDYEALFDKHRSSLLDVAAQLSVPVVNHKTSFDALLRKVDTELSSRERRSPKGAAAASFVEARVAVAALHDNAHLFRGRSTMHSLLVQDAIMFGIGDQIGKAFDWVVAKVKLYKCTWCKGVLKFIKRSACDAAGTAICNLMTAAMGPVGVVAGKFLCGLPIYLSKLFTTWCMRGLQWIQDKLRLSDDCLCGFSVPTLVIPAAEIKVMGVTAYSNKRRDIAIGQICVTKPGQCAGSTAAQKATYDKDKAAADAKKAKLAAEEEARVRKMSKAEKIAYHTKIIKGEIQSNMSDRLIGELLTSVTGLGKNIATTLIKGAKEVAKGNIKGAVKTVVVDTAKNVAGTTIKQVAKNTAAGVAKAVTNSALGATTKVLTDRGADAANKVVDKKAAQIGKKVEAKVNAAGKAVVSGTAKVVGVVDKKAANTVLNKGNAVVNKVANATGKIAEGTVKGAGHLAVDVTRNAVASNVNNQINKPLSKAVANKISGNSGTKPSTEGEKKDSAPKAKAGKGQELASSILTSTAIDAKKKMVTSVI